MHKGILALLIGSVFMAGCANANKEPVVQDTASDHVALLIKSAPAKDVQSWQAAADETAAVIMQHIPNTQQPLFVAKVNGASVFEQVFSDQLASRLTEQGYPITSRPQQDTLTVSVRGARVPQPEEAVVNTKVFDNARLYIDTTSAFKINKKHWKSYMPTLPATRFELKGN